MAEKSVGPGPETYRGFTLHPFQREAIAGILADSSVIVAAPTGAGKTLVADFTIELALERGERVVYTSPVKALSNQKFRDFRDIYGDDVGIMTGDVTINGEAPLLIMTTEVFRNTIFEDARKVADVAWTIFDEVHYLDDLERGTVWEESIIFAPESVRFLCLSATVPNVRELADWIREIRAHPVEVIESSWRPVPLEHFLNASRGELVPVADARQKLKRKKKGPKPKPPSLRALLDRLEREKMLPCLYFCFSRKDCEKLAQANANRNLLTGEERTKILSIFDDLSERYQLKATPSRERLRRMASHGSIYHHAGLLPIYKEIVERLFTSGLIKLLFTTETFALGVNMPARTVVFHGLKKFDGISFGWLRTRDYFQMAGRAGRQGIDDEGDVIARIEPKWDDPVEAERVVRGTIEPVTSRFNLSYSGLLSLYDRLGEDLTVAYERSFAKFQRDRKKPKGKAGKAAAKGGKAKMPRESKMINQRLAVLRAAGYLDEKGLTKKGRFAVLLNGYEIHAAELYDYGVFHLADEFQLAILMVAIVFEERKGDASAHLEPGILAEVKHLSERRIREFRRLEFEAGLTEMEKELDFRMASPTLAWAKGATFEELRKLTNISDGDLVRNFRMALQLMRQVKTQVKADRDLPDRFAAAIKMLDRDEVDARRQLELG